METTEVILKRRCVLWDNTTMGVGGTVGVFVMRLLYYSKTTIIDQNRRRRRLARATRAHPCSHCIRDNNIITRPSRVFEQSRGCPRLFYSGRKTVGRSLSCCILLLTCGADDDTVTLIINIIQYKNDDRFYIIIIMIIRILFGGGGVRPYSEIGGRIKS